jgi:exopolysaccharide transport family protein
LDQNEEFVPKRDFIPAVMTPAQKSEAESALVLKFLSKLQVSPIRNSRLVDIMYESRDPVMAARIANTVAKAYADFNLEIKLKATQDAVAWLNRRVEEERKKVDTAEQALLHYKEQHDIITDFSSDEERLTAQMLTSLNDQLLQATGKRLEVEARYKQAAALEKSPELVDTIPEVINDDIIKEIRKQEVDVNRRMSELTKKYGQNHPQIMALQNELDMLCTQKTSEIKKIINSLHNEYLVASAREQSVKAALNRQKGESINLSQKAIDYNVLKREAESSRQMYDLLIKRFKETSVTEEIKTGNIRVVDPAEVPKRPVKPRKGMNILLSIVVGLSIGLGLAFFLEYLDNTIKLPEDIKDYLNIPYLGPVPVIASIDEASHSHGDGADRKPSDDLITLLSPKSTASESYRGIRTGILFSSADSVPQVILVASSGPHEGKTITSANLAVAMAQAGSSILVVDCDMRRPRMHKVFNEERDKGMSNILVGNCNMDEAIIHTAVANIDFIPSGPIPPNPSELLGSKHMLDFIEKAKSRYERIIIDSPPITAVTDAVILSNFVDGIVLVVRVGETHRNIIKNGLDQLRNVNARILGAVLNGVDTGRDSYYYYQYYYYYYGEDGEKKKKMRRKKRAKSRYGKETEKVQDV